MRTVKFKKYLGEGRWTDYIHPGVFHRWAEQYEEFESGPGNQTYGLIELPDGSIEMVLPEKIKFDDSIESQIPPAGDGEQE